MGALRYLGVSIFILVYRSMAGMPPVRPNHISGKYLQK